MREALVFKLITRVASPRTLGASTLNHEVFDHSVKDQAVIKTLLSEVQKAQVIGVSPENSEISMAPLEVLSVILVSSMALF